MKTLEVTHNPLIAKNIGKCGYCTKEYSSKKQLRAHISRKHKEKTKKRISKNSKVKKVLPKEKGKEIIEDRIIKREEKLSSHEICEEEDLETPNSQYVEENRYTIIERTNDSKIFRGVELTQYMEWIGCKYSKRIRFYKDWRRRPKIIKEWV